MVGYAIRKNVGKLCILEQKIQSLGPCYERSH